MIELSQILNNVSTITNRSNKIVKAGNSIDSLSFNSIESFNISRNYFSDFGNILYVCKQEKKIVYDYSGEYFYE